MNTAIQLWSVRDETEKNFMGTLEKLARMGYDGVEFAGTGRLREVAPVVLKGLKLGFGILLGHARAAAEFAIGLLEAAFCDTADAQHLAGVTFVVGQRDE